MGTTNILDLKNRVDELEKAVSGGDSTQANKADIATEFSTTTAYTAGCFVYYGGKLYQFNVDHAAGAWDATEVAEANVTDEVTSVESRIDAHDLNDRVSIESYNSSNKYTCPSDGYIFVYNTSNAAGYIAIDDLASIGAAAGRFSTFVRKGTQVWVEGTVTAAYFSSLQ